MDEVGFYIRFPIIIVCIFSITIVTSCNRNNQTDMTTIPYAYDLDEKNVKTDEETGIHYVDNIVLVFFDIGIAEEEKMRVVNEIDGKLVGRIDSIDQFQIQVPSRSLDELKELCSQIDDMNGVISTSFDIAYQDVSLDYIPNDPWGGNQDWDVQAPDGNNWWAEAIDAPGAWEYKDALADVKVGVVDNGFDYQHEDLKMELLLEGIVNKEDHGTMVAGIIGATGDNKRGITGIAPNASLICYDWKLDDYNIDVAKKVKWNTSTAISTGLVICVENGAKIINFSVGNAAPPGNFYTKEEIQAWGENESKYIASLLYRGYDFLVIQSAGNGGLNNIGIDAINNGHYASITKDSCKSIGTITAQDILDRILIVGATEKTNHLNDMFLTSFSNCGKQVEIAAPGRKIYATKNGGYGSESGTSLAAPIVSGVAALVWGANEKLTGAQVKEILCSSTNRYAISHPLTKIEGTYPVVNARLAVEKALESKNGFISTCTNNGDGFDKESVIENIIEKTWYSENYDIYDRKNRKESDECLRIGSDGTIIREIFGFGDLGEYEVIDNNTIKAVFNDYYLNDKNELVIRDGYFYEAIYQYDKEKKCLNVTYSDNYKDMNYQCINSVLYDHVRALGDGKTKDLILGEWVITDYDPPMPVKCITYVIFYKDGIVKQISNKELNIGTYEFIDANTIKVVFDANYVGDFSNYDFTEPEKQEYIYEIEYKFDYRVDQMTAFYCTNIDGAEVKITANLIKWPHGMDFEKMQWLGYELDS